jgi:hypothetical protein
MHVSFTPAKAVDIGTQTQTPLPVDPSDLEGSFEVSVCRRSTSLRPCPRIHTIKLN